MLGYFYSRNVELLDATQKTTPLQVFQGMLDDNLLKVNKRNRGQPSSVSHATIAFKKQRTKCTPDVRKDSIDHFPE